MPDLAAAERELTKRAGSYLALARVDVSGSTPVAAYQGPIAEALAYCGAPPTDPSVVTDADMVRLANANWFKFLDVAELRLLETASGALVNRGQSQRWADYSVTRDLVSYQAYLADRRKAVRLKWGYGVSALVPGTVDLNFAARCRHEF